MAANNFIRNKRYIEKNSLYLLQIATYSTVPCFLMTRTYTTVYEWNLNTQQYLTQKWPHMFTQKIKQGQIIYFYS